MSARRDAMVLDLAMESLRLSGRLRFRAQGTSMLPTIQPGAQVEIGCVSPAQIAAGDIVLRRTATGLQLHRVIEVGDGVFVTRGDNHAHNDEPCRTRDVLGKLHQIGPAPGLRARLLRRLR